MESKEKVVTPAENAKYLIKVFLVIFILTYFIWYLNGGPERWDEKFKDLGFDKNKEHIFTKGVLKIK